MEFLSPLEMNFHMLALVVVLLAGLEQSWAASCVVDSFTVKEDFDPKRVSTADNTHVV